MSSKSQAHKVKKQLTALLDRADQTCRRIITLLARLEASTGEGLGVCFLSDGTCEQLTEGTCPSIPNSWSGACDRHRRWSGRR